MEGTVIVHTYADGRDIVMTYADGTVIVGFSRGKLWWGWTLLSSIIVCHFSICCLFSLYVVTLSAYKDKQEINSVRSLYSYMIYFNEIHHHTYYVSKRNVRIFLLMNKFSRQRRNYSHPSLEQQSHKVCWNSHCVGHYWRSLSNVWYLIESATRYGSTISFECKISHIYQL